MAITRDLRDLVVRATFIWSAKDGRHLSSSAQQGNPAEAIACARFGWQSPVRLPWGVTAVARSLCAGAGRGIRPTAKVPIAGLGWHDRRAGARLRIDR